MRRLYASYVREIQEVSQLVVPKPDRKNGEYTERMSGIEGRLVQDFYNLSPQERTDIDLLRRWSRDYAEDLMKVLRLRAYDETWKKLDVHKLLEDSARRLFPEGKHKPRKT